MMELITVNEALAELNRHGMQIDPGVFRNGLIQGVFPFGFGITPDGVRQRQAVYKIFRHELEKWIRERDPEQAGKKEEAG